MKNNHINQSGDLHMIDISEKEITLRAAKATGEIILNDQAFDSILQLTNKKGDVLNAARIAGINAVKQTSNLIPLAHTIVINAVTIEFKIEESTNKIYCYTTVNGPGVHPLHLHFQRRVQDRGDLVVHGPGQRHRHVRAH